MRDLIISYLAISGALSATWIGVMLWSSRRRR